MLVAESEAKFKYCPFLTTHDDKLRFCQGTMCMMWRFDRSNGEQSKGFCGLAEHPLRSPNK